MEVDACKCMSSIHLTMSKTELIRKGNTELHHLKYAGLKKKNQLVHSTKYAHH